MCMVWTNHRSKKKKWRGKCLEVLVTSSVLCLLFTPMRRLVSRITSRPSLTLSLGVHRIQDYFKNNRGKKQKYINSQ